MYDVGPYLYPGDVFRRISGNSYWLYPERANNFVRTDKNPAKLELYQAALILSVMPNSTSASGSRYTHDYYILTSQGRFGWIMNWTYGETKLRCQRLRMAEENGHADQAG